MFNLKKIITVLTCKIFSLPDTYAEINHYEKAMMFWRLDKKEEAIAEFDKASKQHPDDPSCYLNKGVLLYLLGRYQEALSTCNILIKRNPNYSVAYLNRGNVLSSLNKFEEAITSYNKAIEIYSKQQAKEHVSSAYIGKGEALMQMGKLAEALEAFNIAIQNIFISHFNFMHTNKGRSKNPTKNSFQWWIVPFINYSVHTIIQKSGIWSK